VSGLDLNAIRAGHTPTPNRIVHGESCRRCYQPWPCPTTALVGEVEHLRDALQPFAYEGRSHERRGEHGAVCNTCGFDWPCDHVLAALALYGHGTAEPDPGVAEMAEWLSGGGENQP